MEAAVKTYLNSTHPKRLSEISFEVRLLSKGRLLIGIMQGVAVENNKFYERPSA